MKNPTSVYLRFLQVTSLMACLFLLWSCGKASKAEDEVDTPVNGRIKIVADESLKNVVNAQVMIYEATYPRTKFDVEFMPQELAIRKMLKDEARLAITTRGLNTEEIAFLKGENYNYIPATMALDGVALIVNRSQSDTTITISELKTLVENKKTTLIFDNSNSGNLSHMINRLQIKDITKAKVSAANNNKEVIDYVRKNTGVIGVIGLNWISDNDNAESRALKQQIRVLAVKDDNIPAMSQYALPTPNNLRWRKYALERKVYMLMKEARWGLGRGFIRFACSQPGQLIVEKEGLQPFYLFSRDVKIEKRKL